MFQLILTQDELQISSWCEHSFNVFFYYSFRSLGPKIGTHGNYVIFLVLIVQPTLNKNNKIQNSTSLVHEAKD